MTLFLAGAISIAYAVAGLFFFKFWRETRDRLFAMFAAAFWILSLNYVAFPPSQVADEALPFHYLVRFMAFSLILLSIVDKNRARPRK
jgi:hypothetical protein